MNTDSMKRFLSKGFTLVELLIVIALLGVIATIVIAAINPIEQANRAHDAQFKADGSQLISALERYYAAKTSYPWVDTSFVTNPDLNFGYVTASNGNVGICDASGCGVDGLLIAALELKSEFRQRNFVKYVGSDLTQQIMIGKANGASQSVYACYVPLSKTDRDNACKASQVYTLDASTGSRTAVACTASSIWVTVGSAWYVCVPD